MSDRQEHPEILPLGNVEKQYLLPGDLAQVGTEANRAAARFRFVDYQQRRASETLRRQQAELTLFSNFLHEQLNLQIDNLFTDPQAWIGITWGLVEAFIKWQLQLGYAVSSINVHLSTLKTYARLAMQAGTITSQEYALIRALQGYSRKEQRRIDNRRPKQRIGLKKAVPVGLTAEQAKALKVQPDTPQGRRDALMMCLLLDHGLRVGELAAIVSEEIDLKAGILHFYRPKVGKEQKHKLSHDSLHALLAYKNFNDMPSQGPLLRSSLKDNSLTKSGMSERAITQRVKYLGEVIGITGLSAHDCRHYWATTAAKHGTDPFSLQEAGGWSSLAMPRRYIDDNEISNEDVKLE